MRGRMYPGAAPRLWAEREGRRMPWTGGLAELLLRPCCREAAERDLLSVREPAVGGLALAR
jgi:hypothetical protein